MRLKISAAAVLIIAVFFTSLSGNAKPLTRKEVSKFVQEGEYDSNGKRVSKKVTRRPAGKVGKKKAAKASRRPAKHTLKKSKKKPQKHNRASLKARSQGLPYAKETPNEKDMPFISVPKSRVRKKNKTIVMEDPGTKPAELVPAIVPESAPGVNAAVENEEVSREPASPAVNSAPAEGEAPPVTDVREPDTFDTHSGADPMTAPE